jgi:hypothetical protein
VSASDPTLAEDAVREVVGLHEFFESWFAAACPASDETFATLEASLGPSFTMVGPDGCRVRRPDVIAALRRSYGSKRQHSGFRITISETEILHMSPPLVLLGYVEEQILGTEKTRRRSTALFTRSPQGSHGVQWLALHETWMRD